jgi:hypothetical protein
MSFLYLSPHSPVNFTNHGVELWRTSVTSSDKFLDCKINSLVQIFIKQMQKISAVTCFRKGVAVAKSPLCRSASDLWSFSLIYYGILYNGEYSIYVFLAHQMFTFASLLGWLPITDAYRFVLSSFFCESNYIGLFRSLLILFFAKKR